MIRVRKGEKKNKNPTSEYCLQWLSGVTCVGMYP